MTIDQLVNATSKSQALLIETPVWKISQDPPQITHKEDIIARYSTSKAITPDLPIEESENSLIMGDEPLSTIPATESDEVIKSSVENLVPIPSFPNFEASCSILWEGQSNSKHFSIDGPPIFSS
ncbi:hypothetical protein Tco_0822871 [Tanacetum coccineum]|uniref:Uncharacterized protein n=1 Tax=Tanacetum coccineum TaxID=301880 RepID=A0ABQ5AJB4_9ASTR